MKAIQAHMAKNPDLANFKGADRIDPEEMLVQPCDILIPAAVDRVINGANAAKLRCRILAEAANGPTTPEADVILDQRRDEILLIPDILCNAGGVIVSYFEWVQDLQNFFWNETEIADNLFRIMDAAFWRCSSARRRKRSRIGARRWRLPSSACSRRSRRAGCFRKRCRGPTACLPLRAFSKVATRRAAGAVHVIVSDDASQTRRQVERIDKLAMPVGAAQ